ncbi:hypothetical protein J7K41_00100 [Candidatus Micrarchaeota archaeon]|nr:hypothetical protein [Candidatus Micrarchaeota archaeon]
MPIDLSPSKFAYVCIGIALLAALGTFIKGGAIAVLGLIVGVGGAIIAYILYKYGYFIVPMITKMTRTVILTDTGYEIPPSQDVIVRKINNVYYASMFLAVRIYESASEKTLEENIVYSEYFERAISSVKYVTKFAMLVYVKDISDYRMKIETKRAEAQLKLQREREKPEPDILKLDRYEREVAMWDAEIDKLSKGYKPMSMVGYVMTTAIGVTKEAAIAAARAQAKELRATISNALNCEVEILSGEEMLRCFEWEYTIPPSIELLKQQVE